MPETPLLVTVDVEGDDLWSRPRHITTRNAAYLPRFHALCRRFALKPVYLTDYEMALEPDFVDFARDALRQGAAEIGMHLHAWNTPPLVALTDDDFHHQPFLIEYQEAVMQAKVARMTRLLEDQFDAPIRSHRAGRWALDARYCAILAGEGYKVDCTVTPGTDWSATPGAPGGTGGTDYRRFPEAAYFLDNDDISRPGAGPLLEVPVTVRSSALYRCAPWLYRVPLVRGLANRASTGLRWLHPAENGIDTMLALAEHARAEPAGHLEIALHSSELMPGGSPAFRSGADVERLYDDLWQLFESLSPWCRGMTLAEFHAEHRATPA